MESDLMPTIKQARELIAGKKYKECEALLSTAMFEHPHDAVPHNLMGLLLESQDRHGEAMKHFRAAYALDPTYRPSSWNMECFGSFTMPHACAYLAVDCGADTDGERGGDRA